MHIRAQWKIFFFNFNFWHTFSFVFFNSKTGLFSCIFWSEDSFLCKFSCLCLHSGFTWWSWAKYIGWPKKYINMLNMWIQCYTSSRNITIGSKKWNRILKKIARSPIFCGCFWPFWLFLAVFSRTSSIFFLNLNSLYHSNSGISRWCVTFNSHIYHINIFF